MVSFESDYNNGMLPEILQRLVETNNEKTTGYGQDAYTDSARKKIIRAVGREEAKVWFLTGGTQTNAVVIDALLSGPEAVVAAETGHIAVHEAGAIEASGHKVITLPSTDSKLSAEALKEYMSHFYADATWPHMAVPRLVYLSLPTEWGLVYTRAELEEIRAVCRTYDMKLYIDGARLGYALVSEACDYDLAYVAGVCDAFYIGGTKTGALMGEAVVFPGGDEPPYFFSRIKQHGALLAKGRLLGLQFDTLFTDNLYFRVAETVVVRALEVRRVLMHHGLEVAVSSPTNQQFVFLTPSLCRALGEKVAFEVWEKTSDEKWMCRFVAGPGTDEDDVRALDEALTLCMENEVQGRTE